MKNKSTIPVEEQSNFTSKSGNLEKEVISSKRFKIKGILGQDGRLLYKE